MVLTREHKARVRDELRSVGVTEYGLLKPESRYLHQIIHEDEHIQGAIYGRTPNTGGAMLVATDRRALFLDRMPLFSTMDEVTYDLVSGVTLSRMGGVFAAVTLHTRAGDYTIRFANLVSAEKFVKFIENKCIEFSAIDRPIKEFEVRVAEQSDIFFNKTEQEFLANHELATLSTMDKNGNIDGAAVYYCSFDDGNLYILTKGGTQKMHNIYAHSQVALTIYDEQKLQTLQLQGIASVETDHIMKQAVFNQIVKERDYEGKKLLPPVTQIREESYTTIRIQPTSIKFRDFNNTQKGG